MELVDSSSVKRSLRELSSVNELGARIVDGSGRLAAATCRWLLLVAQFDARQGCLVFGLASDETSRCRSGTPADRYGSAGACRDSPRRIAGGTSC